MSWLALGAVLVGIGYWRSRPIRATYPVRGWVLVGEVPAEGALVAFHPTRVDRLGGRLPTGRVEADGSFELEADSSRRGAEAGEYAVTVEWREVIRAGGESVSGPSLVPDCYTRPASSPLRAVVDVGSNELPPFWIEKRYP